MECQLDTARAFIQTIVDSRLSICWFISNFSVVDDRLHWTVYLSLTMRVQSLSKNESAGYLEKFRFSTFQVPEHRTAHRTVSENAHRPSRDFRQLNINFIKVGSVVWRTSITYTHFLVTRVDTYPMFRIFLHRHLQKWTSRANVNMEQSKHCKPF